MLFILNSLEACPKIQFATLYMCAIIGQQIFDTGLPLLYKTLLTAATVETGELRESFESWRAGDTGTSFPTIIEETGARHTAVRHTSLLTFP